MNSIESLERDIDRYFNEVTDEQLFRDLENAEFSFYNEVGRKVCIESGYTNLNLPETPAESASYSAPVSSALSAAGNNEEMLMAA